MKLILTVLLLSNSILGYSQSENYVHLSNALQAFNQGDFEQAKTLTKKISDTSDKGVLFGAYRLQALCYLQMTRTDSAYAATRKMLQMNPTYQFNAIDDPDELGILIKKFKITPKYYFGISLSPGLNTTFAKPSGSLFTVSNHDKKYQSSQSFNFGIDFGWNINQKLGLYASIYNSVKGFNILYNVNDWETTLTEKLTYIDIPIIIDYNLLEAGKYSLNAELGPYLGYLIDATNEITSSNNKQQSKIGTFNSINRRNSLNLGLIYGGSIHYSLPKGTFKIRIHYLNGFTNITDESTRYSSPQLLYSHYYLDDNIYLKNLQVSVGYSLNLNYHINKR